MDQQIRVLILKDGDAWVAQCLEYDIGTQASDLNVLQERLHMVLEAELAESIKAHGQPFGGIPAAPQHFHDLWAEKRGNFPPVGTIDFKSEINGRVRATGELALCA